MLFDFWIKHLILTRKTMGILLPSIFTINIYHSTIIQVSIPSKFSLVCIFDPPTFHPRFLLIYLSSFIHPTFIHKFHLCTMKFMFSIHPSFSYPSFFHLMNIHKVFIHFENSFILFTYSSLMLTCSPNSNPPFCYGLHNQRKAQHTL